MGPSGIISRASMFRRLIIILAVGAIALTWGLLDGPAARQKRGMEAAQALAQKLQPRLAADPRFASIDVGVRTHPALYVQGTVPDENALRALKAIVVLPADANYRLIFSVMVIETAATRPAH